MKKIWKIVAFLIGLFLLCVLGLTGYEKITGNSLLAVEDNSFAAFAVPITTAAGSSDSADGKLYDADDNELLYHVQTNVVFNSKLQITHDDTSTPLYYNPVIKQFSNEAGNVLSWDRPSSRGGRYLQNGSYTVRSVAITDKFYQLPLSSGGDIYVSLLWENDNFSAYNFLGKKIALSKFTDYIYNMISAAALTNRINDKYGGGITMPNFPLDSQLSKKYSSGKLSELLDRIELVNENATILNAKDDRGKPINMVDGQLFDYFDYPLVDRAGRPLFYDIANDGSEQFFDSSYRRLFLDDEGYLIDSYGDIVHSVITNLLNDEYLYFFFMSDRVTICPLYGTPQTDEDGYFIGIVKFTYLNGDAIDEADFIIPAISEEDIYVRYPELRPPKDEQSILDKILALLNSIINFFGKIVNFLGGIFNTNTLETILLILLGAVMVYVLIKFLKWVFGS